MAEISLKIKSDFEKAAADFKKIDMSSESFQKSLAKLQTQMANGSIDNFMNKNKLAATAMTAAKGATAGLQRELSGLQSEIQRLIKKGIDPLDPSLNKMKNRMNEIQGQLPKAKSSVEGFGSSLTMVAGVLASSAIANKIYDIGKASLMAASDMQQNQIAFKTMLQSASEATNILNQITEFAAKTPFNKNELIGYAKGMIGVGFATKDIIPTMEMLGNIAAGVGQEKLPNIVKAFDKMKAKGRASLEELWPIVEAGVPILEQLAKDLGKSKDEVIKMATAGKLSFEQVQSSLKKVEIEKFNGLMNELATTFGGKLSNLNDNLDQTAVIMGNKMMPAADTWLTLANNLIGSFNKSLGEEPGILSKIYGFYNDFLNPLTAAMNLYTDIASLANEYLFTTEKQVPALKQMNNEIEKHRQNVLGIAEAYQKSFKPDGKDKKDDKGTKKTEAQIFQDNLNAMALSQEAFEQQRLNTIQSFYDQRVALQGSMNEEEMAAYVAQETMKIANSKLTDDQKLAAMSAMNKAVKQQNLKDIQTNLQYGSNMLNTTASMMDSLQTVMKNSGKESRGLAIAMKGLAIAQAGVNTALAITKTLTDGGPFPLNVINAAIIGAAGAAQIAAIATTPIPKAETGLSNYTVPDIRSNRNDGAAVMAQSGETVSVTPRGEENNSLTNINITVSEQTIFSIVAKGIKTGQIDLNSNNVGRGVFAN